MTVGVPDPYLWRRISTLEKQVASMEGLLRRMSLTRHVTPLNGRLWCWSAATDSYNLLDLDEVDTKLDVSVEFPASPLCIEQIDLQGKRHFISLSAPIAGCLAEDHPGCNKKFDIYLGTWSPDDDKWIYDLSAKVAAIDFRFGVPYPDEGSTGLFQPHTSKTYGTIYETVALDCVSPGECNEGDCD